MALKASMKILLIEPNINLRQAVRTMFKDIGFKNIHEASGPDQAWEMIQEGIETDEKIEFVICEYELEGTTGIEFLRTIRADRNMGKVPFLMVTGQAEQSIIVQSIQAGANNFLVKPYSSQMMQEKIAAIFKQGQKKKAA